MKKVIILSLLLLSFIINSAAIPQKLSQLNFDYSPTAKQSNQKDNTLQYNKSNSQSDSMGVYPDKLPSKQPWEKIVNFPSKTLFLPIGLTIWGTEEVVKVVDESKIVPKTITFFKTILPPGFVPKYSSRYGAGISFNRRNIINNGSKFSVGTQFGLRERKRFFIRFEGLRFFRGRFYSDISIMHRFLSDESFFGKEGASSYGNNSAYSDESNFAHKQSTVDITLNTDINRHIVLGARFGIYINAISKGKNSSLPYTHDIITEASLPGLEKNTRIARLQIGIKSDTINRSKRPTAGGLLIASSGIFKDFENDDFNFWKFSASYKHYIHLLYNRSILFRVAGVKTEAFSGKNIPLYYLSELGNYESIRGFTRGRFRDHDMILGSIEYNYPIWRSVFDAILFLDAGQVSPEIIKEFSWNDFHYGYGCGLNVWGVDKLTAQLMVGKSKDRIRYFFNLNVRNKIW